MQVILAEGTGTASLHLLKIVSAAHVPHEDQTFNGLDVGSGGDHIHGDGNARIVTVAELAEHLLWIFGGIGDLFTEVVPFAKFLPDNLDNIVRMAVGLGKYQRFGNLFAPREQRRE